MCTKGSSHCTVHVPRGATLVQYVYLKDAAGGTTPNNDIVGM